MSEAPKERQLLAVERVLRKLKPGAQKKVGGGIYMRLDRAGRRRFQFRGRANGAGHVISHLLSPPDPPSGITRASGMRRISIGESTDPGSRALESARSNRSPRTGPATRLALRPVLAAWSSLRIGASRWWRRRGRRGHEAEA